MGKALVLALVLSLVGAAPLRAGRAEDTDTIVGYLLNDEVEALTRASVAQGYAVLYAAWLKQRGVKLLDGKRFTAMLPEALSDPWVADLPARLAAGCFGTFTDAEMQQAAAAIRRDPEGGTLFPGGQGSGQGRVLRLGHLQEDLA